MIASIVLFLLTVSVVATAAAWVVESGLRGLRVASRWVWLLAMASAVAMLVGPLVIPSGASTAFGVALGAAPIVELSPLLVRPGAGLGVWEWLQIAFLIGWVLSSVGVLGLLVTTHRGLLRERSSWDVSNVHGRDVYLSNDKGPAVAGVVRPWIVLPRWVLSLPEKQLALVVLHEDEHVRGGDSLLLAAALFFVMLMPWNPVAWWQLRRLRMAMEMDCDRRVLRRQPDRAQYGNSLLTVAARASGASLGLATFTERSLSLKRRILAMTANNSRWTPVRAAMLVLLGLIVGVQACAVESPVATDEAMEAGAAASTSEIGVEPTFTPYTDAPTILNREAIVDAMVENYPPLLRDAGIGGTVRVFFFINELGVVEKVQIDESSGHPAIDDAAVAVANVYRFAPALHNDEAVPVWVTFPITFQVR